VTGREVAERLGGVHTLCSFGEALYDGGGYSTIWETLAGREVGRRQGEVLTLATHGEGLFDGGGDGRIYETLTGREVGAREDSVLTFCSHGDQLYDGTSEGLIFETMTHRKLADREFPVTALCSLPPGPPLRRGTVWLYLRDLAGPNGCGRDQGRDGHGERPPEPLSGPLVPRPGVNDDR
jgi:hypothetical protein